MPDNERQFEQDIESFLISPVGGWQKASDAGYRASMDSGMALDLATLVDFVQATQPIQWQRFEKQCNSDPEKKFYKAFENAVENDGLISVLRHGFKHRGLSSGCATLSRSPLSTMWLSNTTVKTSASVSASGTTPGRTTIA